MPTLVPIEKAARLNTGRSAAYAEVEEVEMAVYLYPDFIPQLYGLTQVAYEVGLLHLK